MKRSKLVKEFGLKNMAGDLNCFLNVCLQTLWQFPVVRFQIQSLLEMPKDTQGSAQLKPLVSAILDFYRSAFAQNESIGGECPVIDNDRVRLELFKFFYDKKEFVLHEKADAFEALDQILTVLHCWFASIEQEKGNQITYNKCLDLRCGKGKECFVHNNFFIA